MAHDGKMPYNSDTCEKFAMSFHFFYFRNVKSGRNKQSKWKRIAFEKKITFQEAMFFIIILSYVPENFAGQFHAFKKWDQLAENTMAISPFWICIFTLGK